MEYRVTISSIIDHCPFDANKRSKAYCYACNSYEDPCKGIGTERILASKKVDKQEVKQIINTIKKPK